MGAYEGLINSGGLTQIRDDSLRFRAGNEAAWNHAVLEDPAFLDHLAMRFLNADELADQYRSLAELAAEVLDRVEASIDRLPPPPPDTTSAPDTTSSTDSTSSP